MTRCMLQIELCSRQEGVETTSAVDTVDTAGIATYPTTVTVNKVGFITSTQTVLNVREPTVQ
jgi:hypothetical protein